MRALFQSAFAALLVVSIRATANPTVVGEVDWPALIMTGEEVLVRVSKDSAVVSGRYRFAVAPDARKHWGKPPYDLVVYLPVAVPDHVQRPDDVRALICPLLTIKGRRYYPEAQISYAPNGIHLDGASLRIFHFSVPRSDFGKEFEIWIQYYQPLIRSEGKTIACYVPMLPDFGYYRESMKLREESYLVTFESVGDVSLALAKSVAHIIQQDRDLVSVYAKDMEIVAVETLPNHLPEATPGQRPPATPPPSSGAPQH